MAVPEAPAFVGKEDEWWKGKDLAKHQPRTSVQAPPLKLVGLETRECDTSELKGEEEDRRAQSNADLAPVGRHDGRKGGDGAHALAHIFTGSLDDAAIAAPYRAQGMRWRPTKEVIIFLNRSCTSAAPFAVRRGGPLVSKKCKKVLTSRRRSTPTSTGRRSVRVSQCVCVVKGKEEF
jgi:hypothetical protein